MRAPCVAWPLLLPSFSLSLFFSPGGLRAPCVLACAMRSLFKYINSKCLVLSREESVGEDGWVHQGVHGVAGEQPEEVAEEANEVVTADITLCRL